MKKIAHVREVPTDGLPVEVIHKIKEIAEILDTEYGDDRDVEGSNGGYILVIEDDTELPLLTDIHIDTDTIIPEFTDRIPVSGGNDYTSTLLILGNDFTVTLVMPMAITLERFITEYPGEGWQE